ncbi:MAG: VOC family protein [Candidatus Bathyarchaeota archaeon]|jgi:catechol 2,3-dioxygenase-like lactoylglutathione lyase family enzyme
MIEKIEVICLWAEDVPKTAHFYKDVLGLKLLPHHHDLRPHFKVGDAYLTILKGKPHPAEDSDPDRFPLFAFRVQDLDAAVERLQAHGVKLPWGVEGHNESRWVMFHDPAGNLIELT